MTVPSSEQIRERLLAEIERLRGDVRATLAGSANRVRWLDVELWIDRERWLVLGAGYAAQVGLAEHATAPPELEAHVRGEGPRHSTMRVNQLVELLAGVVIDDPDLRRDEVRAAELVNLMVIEPLIDPAFAELCWCVLDVDCRAERQRSDTIAQLAGPLVADLSARPDEREPVEELRAAQRAFVERYFPRPGELRYLWDAVGAKAQRLLNERG